MTATEELRRMLDERGVEWEADDHASYAYTYWGDWAFTEPLDAKPHTLGAQCELMLIPATPAQAIAATLGSESPRTVYIVESYDSLTEGCYVEPTCYTSKEAAIRRAESQTYDDGDGVQYWAHWKELKVVGR